MFFDEWYESELVGLDGDLKLRRYYREGSELVVPFFSEHYKKPWCEIEWSAIRSMLKNRRAEDAVVPVQMDLTPIDGWEDIDFALRRRAGGRNRTGSEIANLILAAYDVRRSEQKEYSKQKKVTPYYGNLQGTLSSTAIHTSPLQLETVFTEKPSLLEKSEVVDYPRMMAIKFLKSKKGLSLSDTRPDIGIHVIEPSAIPWSERPVHEKNHFCKNCGLLNRSATTLSRFRGLRRGVRNGCAANVIFCS